MMPAQFFGNVFTFRNLPIIAGLEDCGRHDLASELAWMTIKAFNQQLLGIPGA